MEYATFTEYNASFGLFEPSNCPIRILAAIDIP